MIKNLKSCFAGILMMLAMAFGTVLIVSPAPVNAACADGYTMLDGGECMKTEDMPDDLRVVIKNIVNAALFLLGALSVIMLIYGGIRYTISGGDSAAIVAAKNTILYAIVGIVVALMSFAIVQFVISTLTTAA